MQAEALACPDCGGDLIQGEGCLRCRVCGQMAALRDGRIYFIAPPADVPLNPNRDPADPRHWSSWRHANFAYLRQYLASLPESTLILDLGAGVSQFREITHRFKIVHAVDFYPYELVTIVADLTHRFPFRSGTYDVVIASNVLEHMPSAEHFLAECFRVLRPGGLIVGAVPFLMRVHQQPYDFQRFTHFKLRQLLASLGFNEVEVLGLGTPLNVLMSMERHFFYYLLSSNGQGSYLRQKAFYALARSALWAHRVLLWLFLPVMRQVRSSDEFVEGYGFRGRKQPPVEP